VPSTCLTSMGPLLTAAGCCGRRPVLPRLSGGFDLQARFEGAVDAKLTDAVKASFRGSASVSVGAEASAYFPLDVFYFAGVTATLKAQAEARASIKLDVELRPFELVDAVLADSAGSLWQPHVEAVAGQIAARAGLYASAAVCVRTRRPGPHPAVPAAPATCTCTSATWQTDSGRDRNDEAAHPGWGKRRDRTERFTAPGRRRFQLPLPRGR